MPDNSDEEFDRRKRGEKFPRERDYGAGGGADRSRNAGFNRDYSGDRWVWPFYGWKSLQVPARLLQRRRRGRETDGLSAQNA